MQEARFLMKNNKKNPLYVHECEHMMQTGLLQSAF